MIGKIKKGKGFAGLTKYILEKQEAELICTNLGGETIQHFYKQLAATRQLNFRVKFPVCHISISFAPQEKPDKEQLQQITEATLLGMGFDKNLYFAATHDDRDHKHLHIAASRIDANGECVSDWWDKRRLEKVLRSLESHFNLTSVPCSWDTERTAPSTGQKRRMLREQQEIEKGLRLQPVEKSAVEKIQDAVSSVIRPGVSMSQFLEKLEATGVKTAFRVTQSGMIQGISYSTSGVAFPGAKLGRLQLACTLKGLIARGISCDINRDAAAIAQRADCNTPNDEQISMNTLIEAIQNHPSNFSLFQSNSQERLNKKSHQQNHSQLEID